MGNEQSGGGGQQYRADYRSHPAAPARSESDAERAERLQRVQAYDEKMKKFAKKDPDIIKQENWQKYNAIGSKPAAAAAASAPQAASSFSSSSSAAAVPPPPAHWNATSSARAPSAAVTAGYPGAVTNHSLQPKRAVTGGSGYSGTAATASAAPSAARASNSTSSSSSSSSAATLPFDPNRARAARAAAMTAKTSRIKSYKPPVRADQWETYKQLEAIEKGKTAAVPIGATPGYGPGVYGDEAQQAEEEEEATEEEKAMEAAAAAEEEKATAAGAAGGESSDAAFYQQMFHLVSKAQRMPVSSLSLLVKILSNLLRADSTPDGSKFRRLKLDNEKMQREIVKVDGAVEILFAVGFQRAVGDAGEDVLVCSGDTDLGVARLALDKLQTLAERK